MSPQAAAVLRHLWSFLRWPVLIISAVGLLGMTAASLALRADGRYVDRVTLPWTVVAAPGFALFVYATVVASMFVRLYIAFGITRRDIVTAAAALLGWLSALLVVVLAAVAAIAGLIAGADGPGQFATVPQAVRVASTCLLTLLAWSVSGWLVGIGFVRFGAWRGIAFSVPAIAPAVTAMGAARVALTDQAQYAALWVPLAVLTLIAGAWAVPLLTRGVDVPEVLSVPA